ncbi:MAG TPA: Hsp20/alpha crystallin family protein [Nevskia sp.]|jgi:HSP20 family protein|nr:Hsp20/alpha crystallin family protein [Nevskia sp.]
MSSIIRYEPWSMHRELLNEFNRFFERASNQDGSSGATADWVPAVDIEEHPDRFVIYADVPGVDPQGIDITLEQGQLTLSGARERAAEQAGVEGRRVERASGRFFRRFTLPDTADGEAVSARGANGVLEVVIPKRQAAQPRRIAVTH